MADVEDKPSRKSVSFADAHAVVDEDGNVKEGKSSGDGTTAESHSAGTDPAVEEVTDMFASLAKKKKKPKKDKAGDDDADAAAAAAPAGEDGELDLSSLKKKKKKKSKVDELEKELAGDDEGASAEKSKSEPMPEGDPVAGTGIYQHNSTADIPYNMLLSRFFTFLSERHPDLVGGVAKSFKIPPPQCLREGNKKTLLANLPDICKRLKRSPEHITAFLFAELGTSGSTDANGRLIIRGRFQSKQIENVLRRYIMDYVICKTCKSADTELSRGENRLSFITCNSCASRRSVAAIKSGFSAQIGKRKRQVSNSAHEGVLRRPGGVEVEPPGCKMTVISHKDKVEDVNTGDGPLLQMANTKIPCFQQQPGARVAFTWVTKLMQAPKNNRPGSIRVPQGWRIITPETLDKEPRTAKYKSKHISSTMARTLASVSYFSSPSLDCHRSLLALLAKASRVKFPLRA
ncbi:uncharacterized protein PV09_07547 [Verruconis gallopava]|uniref:Translation initiation factor IF2/IF5 domain-containing protein n=1 Tax=Verruconis gallopava TaxID=253628 RepID=A0A0D2A2S4_9PEZI|nr:uncharacterized protein PV09_07547 [Verruconis gallopava]KIW01033.1 hypothetical protein PV09_07547 [Verruconis gallopava]